MYGRAAFIHTFDGVNNPTSETWAHSEYINAGSATIVTVYMRNIARIRPSLWGWNSYIFLKLSDGVGQHNYHLYEYREYPTGQTLEVNNYNFTALGADGQTWYGYTREIPSALNKTHLRVSIGWRAHTWYWYSPASVDISSYVDSVTISAIQYELTVTSSPITGITFTINGTPQTTQYTEWLVEGSYTLEMPQTHNGYVWSHWLEDGDLNRIKMITLPGTTWTGVFAFAVQPHGPQAEFTATPETANVVEPVKFDASSSLSGFNGTHEMPIGEYRWDFADGNQTTTSTPIVYHGFSSPGIYYVTLTVYAHGATPETDSTTNKVTVIPVPVGGYSVPIKGYTTEKPLTLYLAIIGILTAGFTIAKRRRKQQS